MTEDTGHSWPFRQAEHGSWTELFQADCDRNAGMPIELISAEVYAQREGMTREAHIIRVLRADRERRQAEAQLVSDRVLLDGVIDSARAAEMTVVEYITSDQFLPKCTSRPRRTWDISPDFLAQLLTRVEERQRTAIVTAPACAGSGQPWSGKIYPMCPVCEHSWEDLNVMKPKISQVIESWWVGNVPAHAD